LPFGHSFNFGSFYKSINRWWAQQFCAAANSAEQSDPDSTWLKISSAVRIWLANAGAAF
jgi:hypothetical protein